MLDDIFRQPEAIHAIARRSDEFTAFARNNLLPGPGGRLFAFGSGDGWFAARAVAPTVDPDIDYRPRSALQLLLEDTPRLGPADRVLSISMSGDVDRSVEAVAAVRERGAGVALLTNGEGGRVGAMGVPRISLDLPGLAPFLCGTSSYLATLAALTIMLGGPNALDDVAESLTTTLDRARGSVPSWPTTPSAVRLLSVGASVATADYGAAKLVEVGSVPVWSDDLEEFAHRQFWTMDRDELVILLAPGAAFAAYGDPAAEALTGFGPAVASVENSGAPIPSATTQCALPEMTGAHWPMASAIPLQLYAYAHAFDVGLDPNRRLHLKEDEARFRTSRLLTRRSLLGTGQ